MNEFTQWYAQVALVVMLAVFIGSAARSAWDCNFKKNFLPKIFLWLLISIFTGIAWPVTLCLLAVVIYGHWEDA